MTLRERLLPTPRLVVLGQPGTGWLGLVSSWVLLGFGAVLTAASGSGLADLELACAASTRVCGAAAWGGVIAGVTSLAVALLFAEVIARGFGPPIRWWMLPTLVGTIGAGIALGALLGTGTVPLPLLVVGVALLGAALVLVGVVLLRGRAAVSGWVRMDGLPARDVGMRGVDALLPVVAVVATSAGAGFAAHVARLLASG